MSPLTHKKANLMLVKISFECSQSLTPLQLAFFRKAIEDAVDAICCKRIDMPTLEDIPEYFFTALTQEELTQ